MAWVEQEGEVWSPKDKGEELIGVISEIERNQYGETYFVENEDGDIKKLPKHKILMDLMSKARLGLKIKVVYEGNKPTKLGNPINLYKVWFDEPEEQKVN